MKRRNYTIGKKLWGWFSETGFLWGILHWMFFLTRNPVSSSTPSPNLGRALLHRPYTGFSAFYRFWRRYC